MPISMYDMYYTNKNPDYWKNILRDYFLFFDDEYLVLDKIIIKNIQHVPVDSIRICCEQFHFNKDPMYVDYIEFNIQKNEDEESEHLYNICYSMTTSYANF